MRREIMAVSIDPPAINAPGTLSVDENEPTVPDPMGLEMFSLGLLGVVILASKKRWERLVLSSSSKGGREGHCE
jgi:hypothetical protein